MQARDLQACVAWCLALSENLEPETGRVERPKRRALLLHPFRVTTVTIFAPTEVGVSSRPLLPAYVVWAASFTEPFQ